jgi:hypothetical protein
VILKLDAGPVRIVSDYIILAKQEELFEQGFTILMGLPNATSVQQEMDALYGPFTRGAEQAFGKEEQQSARGQHRVVLGLF